MSDIEKNILKNHKIIRELYEINTKYKNNMVKNKLLNTPQVNALMDLFRVMERQLIKEIEMNESKITYKQMNLIIEVIDRFSMIIKEYEEGETVWQR